MDVENQNNKQTVLDIGQALIKARESQNLTAQDIATQMNLALLVIEKIESNQFNQDIPLAFIRGYLRSYANKVNADVETLSVEFDRQTGLDSEPIQKLRVVSNFKSSRKEVNSNHFLFKLVTFLIIASLLGFGGWEAWKRYGLANQGSEINQIPLNMGLESDITEETNIDGEADSESELSPDLSLNTPQENTGDDSFISNSLADDTTVDGSQEENSMSIESIEQTSELADEAQADLIEASAQFIFSEDCWVQVTDANGETLAIGEKKSGRIMNIKGVAPFTVILGKPSAVTLTFENKNFDLSGFRADRRAEFKLGSSN